MKTFPLLSPDLDRKLAALETDEAKASEMEHALAVEIHVHLEEDPVFYESLRDRLQRILEDKKARRIESAEELQRCLDLRGEIASRGKAAEAMGLSPTGRALYDVLGADLGAGEVRRARARPFQAAGRLLRLAARGRTLFGNSRGLILKGLQARNCRKTYFHHGLLGFAPAGVLIRSQEKR